MLQRRSFILHALALCTVLPVRADKYGYNHVAVSINSPAIAANFPAPPIPLYSPAFQDDSSIPSGFVNGTSGPTPSSTVESYLAGLASHNSWMTYHTADFQSEEGRSFPYVLLTSTPAGSNSTKLKVWVQGAMHGNEPAGDQATLALLGALDRNQSYAASLLDKLDIMVLPRYNPDGVFYFQRTLATNSDPNRDHTHLRSQQTRDIKSLYNQFDPHVVADMHEYSGNRRYGSGLYYASDGLYAAAKNLNIHPDIRNLSETLYRDGILQSVTGASFSLEPYVTSTSSITPGKLAFNEAGSDAKIGRNTMGLTQSIAFLFETRGIGLASQYFRRRTACSLQLLTSLLEISAQNAAEVHQTITASRSAFITNKAEITITDIPTLEARTALMVWINNGTLTNLPIDFYSYTNLRPNLTRSKPEAYLIPSGWAATVIPRLEVLGLEVSKLSGEFKGEVEALTVTKSEFGTQTYEGTVLHTVETSVVSKNVNLPAGSYLVSSRQKNAGLAFVVLEPENIDSFVSFNVIPLALGDEYPIYRVM